VVNRVSQETHSRLRRTWADSDASRESTTRVSGVPQKGHFIG